MAHRMQNLPTMTVLAERSEHGIAQLCTPCLLCGESSETARHLRECPVQPVSQHLHTWLGTHVGTGRH